MSCEYIYIYKGDDTDWNNEQLLQININPGGPTIDLSEMTATFILGSYKKEDISLATGSFTIDLGAAVTGDFPYGAVMGIIRIYDSEGRVKTVANKIPFYVTNDVITLQNQNLVIDVPQVSIDITVGGTVSYNNLTNKPAINGTTIEGDHLADYYGLATTAGLSQKVSKSGDTMTGDLVMSEGTKIELNDGSLTSHDGMLGLEGEDYWLRVDTTSGLGAAIKSTQGVGNVLTTLDVKSTYSSTGTDPVNGTAVASAISTKQDTITGAATSITQNNLTSNKALISDGSGKVSVSNVTSTELGYVSGVTGAIQTQITNEVNARTNADNDLQGQIDAISASSDVTDIVGTYAELQAYDTSKLKDNDIIKVLTDSTHNNASSYYRWSTHTHTFTYIGSEGPYYTKSEADAEFLSQSSAATTYLTQANAATTYETQANATASLALKASNADGTSIVDNGTSISTVAVKEQRASTPIKQWVGTAAQLPVTKDSNTLYVVTDENDSAFLTVDSSLSSTSENPVQNKVIYQALQDIDALPAQTGQSGKFLTTNGTTASWASVPSVGRKTYKISGFSANDYALINYIPTGTVNSFEISVVAKYVVVSSNYSAIFGQEHSNITCPQLMAQNSNYHMVFTHPLSEGQWGNYIDINTVQNTVYRYGWTWYNGFDVGSVAYGYDGIRPSNNSVSNSTLYWTTKMAIGVDASPGTLEPTSFWEGWIDLATILIRVNDEVVFDGRTAVEGVDFTIVGNPTIVEE